MAERTKDIFSLKGRVAIITGGAGLLGRQHADIIAAFEGIPVLLDIDQKQVEEAAKRLSDKYKVPVLGLKTDITDKDDLERAARLVKNKFNKVDILINNASNNPKVESSDMSWSRFENFKLEHWQNDLAVGLTGAFLCSQVFGEMMTQAGQGVILNIASDLAVIAPDQRIYRKEGLPDDKQPVKPVTYSVVKSALCGMTRYLATYWADKNIRVNALVPGGVANKQPENFVKKLTKLIPMARMARPNEYQGAVLFLVSDASSYMTGTNLIVDGGRTCW